MPVGPNNLNYVRIGESMNERGSLDGDLSARLCFVGPSIHRYDFLAHIFGVQGIQSIFGDPGLIQVPPCLYQGGAVQGVDTDGDGTVDFTFPLYGERAQLYPWAWDITELRGSAPGPMENCTDFVTSNCPVKITIDYRPCEYGNHGTVVYDDFNPLQSTHFFVEHPQWHRATHPQAHRTFEYDDFNIQGGGNVEGIKLEHDKSPHVTHKVGSFAVVWMRIPNPDRNAIQALEGCVNATPFLGWPAESLMFKGTEWIERRLHPAFTTWNVRFIFAVEVSPAGPGDGAWGFNGLVGMFNRVIAPRVAGGAANDQLFARVMANGGSRPPHLLKEFNNNLFLTL